MKRMCGRAAGQAEGSRTAGPERKRTRGTLFRKVAQVGTDLVVARLVVVRGGVAARRGTVLRLVDALSTKSHRFLE